MFPKHVSAGAARAVLVALLGAVVAGCGSPYYVEGQDELGDLPDSLRIRIEAKEKAVAGTQAVQANEGVLVRELATPEEGTAEKARPLPLEYATEGPYLLRRGDKVLISVLFYPELETTSVVRPDGMITAPGVGDVAALGRRPEEVAADIEAYYSRTLRDPTTTLNVVQFGERRAYVVGEVLKPGPVDLEQRMTLTQAISSTGSVTKDAKLATVILLRRKSENTAQAYRLDLRGVLAGKSLAADVVLQPDDVVYVPPTTVSNIELFVKQVFGGLLPIPDFAIRSYEMIRVKDLATIRRPGQTTTVIQQ
jgi:protein involved in polysaccharide export with SLBB domain